MQTPTLQWLPTVELDLPLVSHPSHSHLAVVCAKGVCSRPTVGMEPVDLFTLHSHSFPECWRPVPRKGKRERRGFLCIGPRNAGRVFWPCSICQRSLVWLGRRVQLRVWEGRERVCGVASHTLLQMRAPHLNGGFSGDRKLCLNLMTSCQENRKHFRSFWQWEFNTMNL